MKQSLKYSSEELIQGLRDKDNHILKYLLDKCSKPIKQYVLKNNGSGADADDILQEAIIVVFRKVKEDDFTLTSNMITFVFAIAKRLWLKELKSRKTRSNLSIPTDDFEVYETILSDIEKNERLKIYREKFEELKEDCKKVLRLFYLGTPMTQITEFMGYGSDDYTKKKKYSCKNSLVSIIKTSKEFKELSHENHS